MTTTELILFVALVFNALLSLRLSVKLSRTERNLQLLDADFDAYINQDALVFALEGEDDE